LSARFSYPVTGFKRRKVTVFGESAGALSASHHYLNENFSTVARAAVRPRLPHYARSASSHGGTTRRFSNLELVLPLPSLMVTAQLLLGCSSQTTRDLAPRPRQITRSLASSPPTHLIFEPAWTPLLPSNYSPFSPFLMGPRAFSATSPLGDYRMGRADKCHLWLAQPLMKVCFFQAHDGTLTLAQGRCSFRRTFELKILQFG
jgi:hypothetical protein